METTKNDELLRNSTRNILNRLVKELPILQQQQKTINDIGFYLPILPLSLHNLAVMRSEKIYIFLQPILDLWDSVTPIDIEVNCVPINDNKKSIVSTIQSLLKKDKEGVARQQKIIKTNNLPPIPVELLDHIEYDVSDFIFIFVEYVNAGYEPTDQQISILEDIFKLISNLTDETVKNKTQAINNCRKILGL